MFLAVKFEWMDVRVIHDVVGGFRHGGEFSGGHGGRG